MGSDPIIDALPINTLEAMDIHDTLFTSVLPHVLRQAIPP
jgi:hypothetical protein